MSYIRCTSNPESLYIWGDVSGDVCITQSDSDDMKRVPQKIWDKLFARAKKDDWDLDDKSQEYIEVDGFRVTESIPDCAPFFEAVKNGTDLSLIDHKDMQIVMSYKDWAIEMYPVTFCEIERNATWVPPNPPPWKVLTGVWLFNKVINWISLTWYRLRKSRES